MATRLNHDPLRGIFVRPHVWTFSFFPPVELFVHSSVDLNCDFVCVCLRFMRPSCWLPSFMLAGLADCFSLKRLNSVENMENMYSKELLKTFSSQGNSLESLQLQWPDPSPWTSTRPTVARVVQTLPEITCEIQIYVQFSEWEVRCLLSKRLKIKRPLRISAVGEI